VVVSGHDTTILGDAIPDCIGDLLDLVPEAEVLPIAEITWWRLQDLSHAPIAVPSRAMTIGATMLVVELLPRFDHGSESRHVHGSVGQFRPGVVRAGREPCNHAGGDNASPNLQKPQKATTAIHGSP
jgi:hypothetical protein